ncbi:RNA polymerase sigma factor [Aliamphritea ceti]|uniref:RNA polymerase sigma factor n=1 Tax=Aliamphritea ceti TaxID=1524258 RepID=UPI0021C2CAEC|nr:RNA polymerase sigma factor [Aliamphritea ceti]
MNSFFCDSTLQKSDAGDTYEHPDRSDKTQQAIHISELYKAHRHALLLHLQAVVKDRDIAEELLQETFVRIAKMPAISVIQQPRPFLLKTARNLALDYIRQQKKRPTAELDEVDMEFVSQEPEHLDVLIKERRLKQLKQVVTDLPPRAKEALMLAKYREMTLKEVAREMDISQTMVEKHLKTALQKCRAALLSEKH